jgi:hypothetical protein
VAVAAAAVAAAAVAAAAAAVAAVTLMQQLHVQWLLPLLQPEIAQPPSPHRRMTPRCVLCASPTHRPQSFC